VEAGNPGRQMPEPLTLKSTQALVLEIRRIHLAQQIEDLELELSLLLQAANSDPRARGNQSSPINNLHVPESQGMLRLSPAGDAVSTKGTTRSPW
jgi:hypothetical protein